MLFFIVRLIMGWALDAYLLILFARAIVSWVYILAPGLRLRGVFYDIVDIIYGLTNPPLRFLDRYIPSFRIGRIALNMSFIVLYLLIVVVRILLRV